jgi:hypothetical protein
LIDGESEDEGDGDKPLTLEEFMEKAREKIDNKKTQQLRGKKAPNMKISSKPKK